MSRTRVLIVDDQPLMRAGFKSVLEASGQLEVIGEAATGAEAIEQARRLHPDVVLMDMRHVRHRGHAPDAPSEGPRHHLRPR